VVILGWPSMFWLLKVMEVFMKGKDLRENWKTFRQGSTAYVVHRRGNKFGRSIEFLGYGGGGQRSFIIIPKGRDKKGWGDCWI
jgi:hypothetical protein